MKTDVRNLDDNMRKIMRDVELIKNILASEGELSDLAKTNLDKARKEDESEYTDLEDL